MKSFFKNVVIIILFSILSILLYNTYRKDNVKIDKKLEVDYIDVGQGNASLVKNGKFVLLIDGGNRSNSRYYFSYVNSKNIDHVDYLLASHYDEDHIAGLISILNKKKVYNVICPDYKKDTKIYKAFKKAILKSKAKIIHPSVGDEFKLENAKFKILWPKAYKDSLDNENSLVIRLEHGKNSFLFPQDADSKIEDQLIYSGYKLRSDVLMVGHHGSKYSTTKEFLKEVRPKLAIISVGKNNRYKHPSSRVVNMIKNENIKLLRTDLDGDISLVSDGEKIIISTNKKNK